MRRLTEVIIHASATRPDWYLGKGTAEKVAEIRRWHISPPRSWSDIGYHILIDRDGTIAPGRPMAKDGAHVKGKNRGTVGVCLIGGHGGSARDQFEDHFTPKQKASLLKVLADFPGLPVTGHNQYANKGCPCFQVPATLAKWRKAEPAKKPAIWQAIIDFIASIFRNR